MRRQLSFLHSRWTTFPQVEGLPTETLRSYPQASSTGISHVGGSRTQLDHRVVHRPRWRPGPRSGKLSDRSTTSGGGATACKVVRGGAVSIDEEIPAGPGFERTPPHNIEAEQSVLGGMLLSKDAIADVVEIIRADDFYRPAHQMVYEVITDLYGRGEPADAVTVFDELQKRGEMARVGGAAYLHTLTAVVPTAANAGYYAKIVREQAILRRLIEAGTRIVSYGYGGQNEEVDDLVDRAQAEIYKVTERRTSEDYAPLADIMPGALDELEAIGSRGGQMVGVPTGFQDLDQLTNGLHPGQMIVVAARPAIGKSTLGLDFARSAAIKNGMTTVIFSLEMSRNEITMRLLSAEARVALHAMRSGMMSDEDWTRLARRMSEVAEAPLFIDDSPNMSMMEIRAKCRRLKQRNDLRFVVIDYLQLMSSPKKTESRQNEVSEISRAIKLLAKELEVPVIAISQLNRGPEQRTDKRPQVSDLRESGCLTAGTRVLRADTGAETSLGELLESGARDIPVWSLDEKLRLVPRTMTHVFPSGTKEVFRLRLSSGREIEATANHPFMTFDGWRPLGELAPGARVAAPRHVSAPRGLQEWPDDQVTLHAHLAGEGGAVPEGVFSLPKRQIALFLRVLWASGGQVGWDDELGEARLSYTSTSRRLVDDVARLLLRFNVMTRIEEDRQGHRLWVTGADNQLRFLDDIGVAGERFEQQAGRCAAALRRLVGDTGAGAVPRQVWDLVGDSLAVRGATKGAPGPERLRRISTILDDADLELLATNDVFWDEVASVESLGEQPVYDATVLGTHNFVANGISVHNSIEQDADMVILLHREDAYERESPRAGEADLIVAKHRNGPTATVTVAFQGHYSRFVDMAQH
ncbi:replicative DNA helicase [Nonomuraea wenchangensis]|uniref:replicative DNA helicase n=1 Tax=Nonomuraea wenchangensis TaxID=568860 RepID=UPI00384B5588